MDINENRDNVSTVNNIEHGRTYSFAATLSPKSDVMVRFRLQLHGHLHADGDLFRGYRLDRLHSRQLPLSGCQLSVAAGVTLGTLSYYASRDNYAYGDLMWKPQKRVTAMVGYGGSIVRGKHHLSQSADADRHAGFQLPQALRESGISIFIKA